MLDEEKQTDNTLRAQFNEKWTRTESEKLTAAIRNNLSAYKSMISSAKNADIVR